MCCKGDTVAGQGGFASEEVEGGLELGKVKVLVMPQLFWCSTV